MSIQINKQAKININRQAKIDIGFEYPPPPTYLRLVWDGYFPVGNPADVNDWNYNFFYGQYTTPFTSVVVNSYTVDLYGGTGVILSGQFNGTNILQILDYAGSIIDNTNIFEFSISTLTDLYLPAFIFSQQLLAFPGASSLKNIYIPAVTYINPQSYLNGCYALETLNIAGCTDLGGTPYDDGVFSGLGGLTITLTANDYLRTNNPGGGYVNWPDCDGDIAYLGNNNTLTVNWV
jgi:hypothetical protein